MKKGKPLSRRTPLRANPEKARAWQDRSRADLPRRTPLRAINRTRIQRLRASQFGTDGKRSWIVSRRCENCRKPGPSDPAHGDGTRASGADSTCLVPLCRFCHFDFDNLSGAHFLKKHGGPKEHLTRRGYELDREFRG